MRRTTDEQMKQEAGWAPSERPLSGDLSRIVGERGLLSLVLDAVQRVDPSFFLQTPGFIPEFRPQMMLTLVTYSYATSMYGSRDIESAMGTDPMVRYICARTFPEWQSLRRFRRRYRDLIQECLTEVVKQVWAQMFDRGQAEYVGYDWFETCLNQEVASAVRERLDTAALMDGVESD